MSKTYGVLRIVSIMCAAAGIAVLVWWILVGQDAVGDSAVEVDGDGASPITATAGPEDPTEAPPNDDSEPVPTNTPAPTPTPIPTPAPFAEVVALDELADVLVEPLPGCGLLRDDGPAVAGTVTLRCIEQSSRQPVLAAADGVIVNVVSAEAVAPITNPAAPGTWLWAEQLQLGPHVVVDHGPLGTASNVQTVYAGLDEIAGGISLGATVLAGDPLGTVAGPQPELRFSVWSNDTRQDGARTLAEPPPAEDQLAAASALRDVIASPTDPRCPLALSSGSLPGASRNYRNGTHRGIDFNCGAAERYAHSIADGTVVYVVDDYQDPTVPEREAILQRAAIAGFTPHWILVMLYGNVVVLDHGEIPGAGRVVTIYAHLEQVDPAIELGARVGQDQILGELGNRGTNASALGLRGAADPTLHLHWELFIDNWYLGAGLDAGTTIEVMSTALCGAAQTAGCPG